MPHEAVDIKDLLGVQHVVEGAAQLLGQGRIGLGFAQLGRQPLQVGVEALVLLGGQHGGLGEGPLQPGVAGLGITRAAALVVRRLHGAAQAGIGAELLAGVEAFDGVDLLQDGQGNDDTDAGRRLQGGQFGGVGVVGRAGGGAGVGVALFCELRGRVDGAGTVVAACGGVRCGIAAWGGSLVSGVVLRVGCCVDACGRRRGCAPAGCLSGASEKPVKGEEVVKSS